MKTKTLITTVAVSFIAWLGLAQDKTEAEKKWGPPPTKDFTEGFEKGVRYGLMAYMEHPKEDSIPKLTKYAIQNYVLIERNGWKEHVKP